MDLITFMALPHPSIFLPTFYIENNLITAHSIDTIEAMEGKKFWRKSAIGNDFVHEEVLPVLTEKALQFIERKESGENSFFPLLSPDRTAYANLTHSQTYSVNQAPMNMVILS
jgi:hypothetical protein